MTATTYTPGPGAAPWPAPRRPGGELARRDHRTELDVLLELYGQAAARGQAEQAAAMAQQLRHLFALISGHDPQLRPRDPRCPVCAYLSNPADTVSR